MTALCLRAFRQSDGAAALLVGSTIEDETTGFTLKNDGFPSMAARAAPDGATVEIEAVRCVPVGGRFAVRASPTTRYLSARRRGTSAQRLFCRTNECDEIRDHGVVARGLPRQPDLPTGGGIAQRQHPCIA